MKGHAVPHAGGRLRRKLREFWPDRNPLRRRWDRTEAVILGVLLVAFVIGSTLAALIAGRWAYESALRSRHAELSTLRQVPAVLLATASQQPFGFDAFAKAWWRAPDGVRHSGQVAALEGSPAGTRITVWVNPAGWLAGPPLQPSQVENQGALAAVIAVMAWGMGLWTTGLVAHGMADRRRMAAWDDEWRATGPKWSRRG